MRRPDDAARDAGDPGDGPRVRAMTVADLDEVLAIEESSFHTPWKREHFLCEMRERDAVNVVLEGSGKLLGYACVWHLIEELKVNNIAVAATERRRGLGSRLMLQLLRVAFDAGCRHVELEVRPSNLAAIRLYSQLGLVECGRRTNYYANEQEDAVLMEGAIAKLLEHAGKESI
jgi:ribosomal-protein-alanine N-acetyltransferase